MKIVELCPYDMRRPGGVQVHIRDLARWLGDNGHEVRIVAPRADDGAAPPDTYAAGGSRRITVHGTVTEVSYVPRRELSALVAELRAWGAELIHLHTPWTPLLPWQVWNALALPSVATFHATLPGASAGGLLGRTLRAAAAYYLKRLDAAIVPSVSPLQHLKAFAGIPASHVLPPTVDLSPWAAAGAEAVKTRGDEPSVVFLGRFEERKGLDILLQAWPSVAARAPQARLTVAGSGRLEPLVHAALAGPAGASIRHVREPSGEEARRLVADADIFAAPSPFGESFGIVLIEAMAAGTVPVAAENSGYATVLTGPGRDLLVPPGDAAALADAIVKLAFDPGRLERLRAWGRQHAMGYDVSVVGPRYVALFEEILKKSR